jgi:saccharopine dehydrogenase-like NADP-dependent oxidoreductase
MTSRSSAAALLVADGTWDVGTMVNVEGLDPKPFMNLLNEMGLPNRVKDANGDRALAF